jgi:hypothetical protein
MPSLRAFRSHAHGLALVVGSLASDAPKLWRFGTHSLGWTAVLCSILLVAARPARLGVDPFLFRPPLEARALF